MTTQTQMDFGPLVVTYDERVLRPRAWTLLQAEWAAELSHDLPAGPVLELCSGAGHIGQATAVLTGRDLVQVDADPHACTLARANAAANVRSVAVEVRCGDLAASTLPGERFAIVLADPPYLRRDEVEAWPQDPTHAIDGGDDGLELPRRCLPVAGEHVSPGGVVLLQALGRAQVEQLADDVAAAGLELVEVRAEDERRAVALLRPRA
ncbi:methyltransferase [Actinotalea solisilvae]|uniref:methyltransferase n=1 Tax=Actinotalea solisilvae TaxID=2072922 RepID=UPI0018F11871|nr:methyltransferase [Actinotalea solisilvae]